MMKSALRTTLLLGALLLFCACDRASVAIDDKAQAAWDLYRRKPDARSYQNFIAANRKAAHEHGEPHDATGIEYQVRALEVMTDEAARAKDAELANDVVDRVGELESRELVDVYDEALPGAKKRLADAKARASQLTR